MSSSPTPEATSSKGGGEGGGGGGGGGDGKFHFAIDRGGTFTDIHAILPNGNQIVSKLLSEDPKHYSDAPTEGIRRILQQHSTTTQSSIYSQRNHPLPTNEIQSIRMGTTVATNALLERKGEKMGLLISKGYRDLLDIGNQSRPNIFDLSIKDKPHMIYDKVYEVDERIMLAKYLSNNNTTTTTTTDDDDDDASTDESNTPTTTTTDDEDEEPRAGVGEYVLSPTTNEPLIILRKPNPIQIQSILSSMSKSGIQSIAIVFLHSYLYPNHENIVAQMALDMGIFNEISQSSKVMPMMKMVHRGHTACASAYLTPVITKYVNGFRNGFDKDLDKNVRLEFMKSDGGLTPVDQFGGHQAILSGPAGGVIGYAKTAYHQQQLLLHHQQHPTNSTTTNNNNTNIQQQKPMPVIGFDMGGTSTDVSRYNGSLEHIFESTTNGISIQSPQLDIQTIAAGGGSILYLKRGMFIVGPKSVGANPGPICYRRRPNNSGKKKMLAVTDANVLLGRIIPKYFPKIFGPNENEELDLIGTRLGFEEMKYDNDTNEAHGKSIEELAFGFLQVANETMCRPIRNLTQMKGYNITNHCLTIFGGAGPQHACSIARSLGIKKIFIHKYGGILSAYGLSKADVVWEEQEPSGHIYWNCTNDDDDDKDGDDEDEDGNEGDDGSSSDEVNKKRRRREEERFDYLIELATNALVQQGYSKNEVVIEKYLNMRYQGTDNAIMIREPTTKEEEEKENDLMYPYANAFRNQYQREFGFELGGRDIIVDDIRIRAIIPGTTTTTPTTPTPSTPPSPSSPSPKPIDKTRTYFAKPYEWQTISVYSYSSLYPGHIIYGPCIIIQSISTIVLEMDCYAVVTINGDLDITILPLSSPPSSGKKEKGEDDSKPSSLSSPPSSSLANNNNNNKDDDGNSNNNTMPEPKSEEATNTTTTSTTGVREDPIQLSIFSHRFMSIAEQMGKTLSRTSISVNIKERLDFSCALFTSDGGLVANAPHIPVHLGAMQSAVKFQIKYWNENNRGGIKKGEVLVSNHPQLAGGSHLPDITVITPVFANNTNNNKIIFFVASRGHHADIGGIAPGSMPPYSKLLIEEGAMIIAFKLVKDGIFQEDGITEILESPGKIKNNNNDDSGNGNGSAKICGTRNLRDNLSDLRAQVAANNSGIVLLQQLIDEYGLDVVQSYMKFIQNNAEQCVRSMLCDFVKTQKAKKTKAMATTTTTPSSSNNDNVNDNNNNNDNNDGDGDDDHHIVCAKDYMDDGTPIKLKIQINSQTGSAIFDFTGTGPQVLGNINAPPSVTYSAVIYSLRSLVGGNEDIPLNEGCLKPITFIIPKYTLLNPSSDAAVVGGNVVTSQRIVDVIMKAFNACAASQGCMNNLTFGNEEFGYYETIAGGSGAGPSWHGRSGVHTHCTNTRITDPEVLERRYPVLLRKFCIRLGSGGCGKYNGGDGVIRVIEPLCPLVMSILSERRTLRPYGMDGGEDGDCGRNILIRKNGIWVNMGGRCSGMLNVGEKLRIETPGGGGYGPKGTSS